MNSADREAFASFGEEKWRAKFLLKRSLDLEEVSAGGSSEPFCYSDPDPGNVGLLFIWIRIRI